jgi:quinoprotein relay system zinc metallohydrolase 1
VSRIPCRLGLAALLLAALAAGPAAAQPAPRVDAASSDYRLSARELAPGVYVVEGANADFDAARNGCNIINTGFITTGAGVVVVNTGPSRRYGEQLRALIKRTTSEPVVQVLHLNLHPDYFFGNQAFADVPLRATAVTAAGMAREGKAYEDNLYRLCGDWMKGTERRLPAGDLAPGVLRVGDREFELRELAGHTASDLVLIDRRSGVVFAGGLVFADRMPTTPHADPKAWLASLDAVAGLQAKQLVPSHGPVAGGLAGIGQTRSYVQWLDRSFTDWAGQGWEMAEVLQAPVPEAYRGWAAWPAEYVRTVAHLYGRYERAALGAKR